MKYLSCTLLILWMTTATFGIKVNYIYEWKYVDYIWESNEQKEDAIKSGTYNRSACTLLDADKAKDGRIFVTVTKELGFGAPATLTTVTNETGPGGPLLRPYPNWSWHNSDHMCDGMIRCNHIFVLDSGKIGLDYICNPKLLIFNLKDDTLVKTIYIPFDIANNATGFGLLLEPFVYIPKKCTQFLHKMIVILAQDDKKLQAISSLKTSYYWNKLIGLSDRYHRYVLGTVNLNEVNIRYFEMDLAKIQKKMDSIP
ncbi:Major royal jelly protein 3 [Acromyrmex echinatior]|uniref:Major royal jelly protein 3 n=1 Tax=Acromyrmex echinatior TaxID=103372 RepID=F4W6W8_ACREC|nr:Major royal jelly protein 3 [Acromyrmex echinatior]